MLDVRRHARLLRCTLRLAVAIFLLCLAACSTPRAELAPTTNEPRPQGLAGVPQADPSVLLWNRPLEEWTNPVLVVRPTGVELVSRHGSAGSGVLSVEQLKVLLQSLPADAWPLGRVVAVSEISIASAGDEPKIEANSAALSKMLRTLDVQLSWWPSA